MARNKPRDVCWHLAFGAADVAVAFGTAANGYPEFLFLAWWQGGIELVGGGLLFLGLFTRLVAFILTGDMAVAYWMAHAPNSFYPVLNGGDAAILYCFVFLYMAAAGGGPFKRS